jgi:hypothetical protein
MVPTHGLGRRAPAHFAHLIKRVLLTTISFGVLAFGRLKERVAKKALELLCTNILKALENKFIGLYYPGLSCITFL